MLINFNFITLQYVRAFLDELSESRSNTCKNFMIIGKTIMLLDEDTIE